MQKKKLFISSAAALSVSGLLLVVPLSGANAADDTSPAASKKPSGMTALSQTPGTPVTVVAGANNISFATCPAGTIITGGGGQTSGFDIFLTDSFASGNGWAVRGSNRGTTAQTLTAVAICLG
ncbi:hypothetical protein [Micromonospora sp. NPDC005979]|uniref:hypothetical protein n=1 Tax=Micromonospora sp. NPDC005979 TaxID=3156726 RepID=UPI00339DCEBC